MNRTQNFNLLLTITFCLLGTSSFAIQEPNGIKSFDEQYNYGAIWDGAKLCSVKKMKYDFEHHKLSEKELKEIGVKDPNLYARIAAIYTPTNSSDMPHAQKNMPGMLQNNNAIEERALMVSPEYTESVFRKYVYYKFLQGIRTDFRQGRLEADPNCSACFGKGETDSKVCTNCILVPKPVYKETYKAEYIKMFDKPWIDTVNEKQLAKADALKKQENQNADLRSQKSLETKRTTLYQKQEYLENLKCQLAEANRKLEGYRSSSSDRGMSKVQGDLTKQNAVHSIERTIAAVQTQIDSLKKEIDIANKRRTQEGKSPIPPLSPPRPVSPPCPYMTSR